MAGRGGGSGLAGKLFFWHLQQYMAGFGSNGEKSISPLFSLFKCSVARQRVYEEGSRV